MSVVVVVVLVGTKIARSQDLGICACCKHYESVDIGEKLVFVYFELLNMAHQRYKSCIFGKHACGLPTAPTLICHFLILLVRTTATQVSR